MKSEITDKPVRMWQVLAGFWAPFLPLSPPEPILSRPFLPWDRSCSYSATTDCNCLCAASSRLITSRSDMKIGWSDRLSDSGSLAQSPPFTKKGTPVEKCNTPAHASKTGENSTTERAYRLASDTCRLVPRDQRTNGTGPERIVPALTLQVTTHKGCAAPPARPRSKMGCRFEDR